MNTNKFFIQVHKLILNYMIHHDYCYSAILKQSRKLDTFILKDLKLQTKRLKENKSNQSC